MLLTRHLRDKLAADRLFKENDQDNDRVHTGCGRFFVCGSAVKIEHGTRQAQNEADVNIPCSISRGWVRRCSAVVTGLWMIAGLWVIAPSVLAAREGLRSEIDTSFRKNLQQLASKCDALNLVDQANITRQWAVPRDPQRIYTFVPAAVDRFQPNQDAPQNVRFWHRRFMDQRRRHAVRLFELARQQLDQDQVTSAYQLIHEVLHEDPDHSEARRILGYHGGPRKWIKQGRQPRVKKGQATHKQFGWRRNQYWVVESEHFRVTTNHSAEAGRKLAAELTNVLSVWRQVFFRYWSVSGALKKRFNNSGTPLGAQPKYRVVLFAERDDYVQQLSKIEPRIAASIGYYLKGRETSFFYVGSDTVRSTWWHEVTHQFFQEQRHVISEVGKESHFWIVEGVAVFMESLLKFDGYYSLGGFDTRRLQYARARRFHQDLYFPLNQLASMGRTSLQAHPNIRAIYTQAAGMIHLLMSEEQGRYRESVVDYLQAVYQGHTDTETWRALVEPGLQDFKNHYDRFLRVDGSALQFLQKPAELQQLCLTQAALTDLQTSLLRQCDNLEWLDLSFTEIGDQTIHQIPIATPLRDLNLEKTLVTDDAMPHIVEFSKLRILDLSGTRITDQGLASLGQLKDLTELWLSDTAITDAGLTYLEQLTNLEYVDLNRTQVSDAAWTRLRKILPKIAD